MTIKQIFKTVFDINRNGNYSVKEMARIGVIMGTMAVPPKGTKQVQEQSYKLTYEMVTIEP